MVDPSIWIRTVSVVHAMCRHVCSCSIVSFALFVFVLATKCQAQQFGCIQDSIRRNSSGEVMQMNSGRVLETFGGDQFRATLWLPASTVLICGPIAFSYSGRRYAYYRVINTSSQGTVDAFMQSGPVISRGTCYESKVRRPSPFKGNNGELFILQDGSVWEVKFEYKYMYAYYPAVIACPDQGFVIVRSNKINATRISR